MSDSTLALNKNIVSRKRLVGIANFVALNSEARFLSRGNNVLSTEQEIRDTKKAQILMPLLTGIEDVATLLNQAKSGGVTSDEIQINEFIVNLANELVTKPRIWRPRDGEVITGDNLMNRYASSYQITSVVAKDRAYYQNILKTAVSGVEVAVGGTKLKSEIVDAKLTKTDPKEQAFEFCAKLRKARNRIKKHKDKLIQQKWSNKDIVIITTTDGETHMQNDARYNMYTDQAVEKNGALNVEIDGFFDKSPVLVSKQLPDGVDFIVMVFGAAVSLFAIRNEMNMDKVPGVQAYISSLEFDEGTGVFLPHLITIGVADVSTHPAQVAVGYEALTLNMHMSETTSGNKTGTAGLPAPKPTPTKKP